MNRILSHILNISLLLLSSIAAMMGGYLLSDISVWVAFFISFAKELINIPILYILAHKRVLPHLEQKFDRVLFLQVNDPLLI